MILYWIGEAINVTAGGVVSTDRDIFRAKSSYPGAKVAYAKSHDGQEPMPVPTETESAPEELM